MATFRMGQRVRVISIDPNSGREDLIGRTGTIVPLPPPPRNPKGYEYAVDLDGLPSPDGIALPWAFHGHQLAPLLDPGCERFLESIRQLKPLTVRETA